ncbi:MAG: ATP-dependent protease ATPase subunit HslU [Pirellulaceae bacterium]
MKSPLAKLDGLSITPHEVVNALDRHIVGQDAAKRAVAIAVRNRWRRRQLPDAMQTDVSPKNILMVGPTGVGKTEIARRLAKLTGAPFIKVEATKYTEVGYYGRDVESMVRELLDNSIALVKSQLRDEVRNEAEERAEKRLLDLLCPKPVSNYRTVKPDDSSQPEESQEESYERTREKMARMLRDGKLETRKIELAIEQKQSPVMIGGMGVENMDMDFQGMLEKIMPKNRVTRSLEVQTARQVILEQEIDALLDDEKVNRQAIELAENMGIILIDEIDKVIASESKSADVSRQGVQRDLLPIVEGTTVQTKNGSVRTDHILFIAAGAFHKNQPSDLMPELQGRFPIRVELQDLSVEDFVRILREPENSLISQYQALLKTENVTLRFTNDAIEELAKTAFHFNQTTQNIGARRLYSILEHLLEELSFEAPTMPGATVDITPDYVHEKLDSAGPKEDLSRFIL